jgi:hypothetical protein
MMSEIGKFGERLAHTCSKRSFYAIKYLYQTLWPLRPKHPKRIVFIFGCQRSGTTLLRDILDRDLNSKVYGEFGVISRSRRGHKNNRLRPLEEIQAMFQRDRAGLVVTKPIAETQNARKLLAYFAGAKAIFIYRHYGAVVSSNLKLFGQGNGIRNLRPIVNGDSENWRAEGVAPDIRSMVQARFREDMNPYDAAALFWYVRNRFFFDLGLDQDGSVMPLRYEDLTRDPAGTIGRMYHFIGAPCSDAGLALVHGDSAAKGTGVQLSPDIDALCRELLARLDQAHARWLSLGAASVPGRWAWES